LYVVGPNGDQAWAFAISFDGDQLVLAPYPEYYPMRLFGGSGLIAGIGHAMYDSRDQWVPLVMEKRPRYAETSQLVTPILDGKTPDCVWHRLMLDASIPSDCAVAVFTRANDDADALQTQAWLPEPSPYRRGNGTELPWTSTPISLSTWELLFQRATGRYVQIMLAVRGTGRSTPRVRALRAWYPRFSYPEHYLPAIYRADAASASLLDRYMANMEGFFTSIEDRIATVQALLDPRSAPNDALEWLASWFGVALDPSWTEAKRRLFLRNAAPFFEARGTMAGMQAALKLAVLDCSDATLFDSGCTASSKGIRIVENFSRRVLPLGLLQAETATPGLPSVLQTKHWTPAQGADDLNARWQRAAGLSGNEAYPTYLQVADPLYATWSSFSQRTLGIVPQQPSSQSSRWSSFLSSRYSTIAALSKAYRVTYASFEAVPYPAVPPRWAEPLDDWYRFLGVVQIQSNAFQFTVYLPLSATEAASTGAQQTKLRLAQRVANLEKPAHTTFDVQFYWAFFRLGDARLGYDSVLDQGSRASQLLQPVMLGTSYLGSGLLSREQPDQPTYRPYLKGGNPV
jgi:phage tail-like protein